MRNLFLFLSLAIVLVTGCKKDDAVDIRSNITGTYSGTEQTTMFYSQVAGITKADETQTDNATLTIKNGDVDTELKLIEDNISYKANNIKMYGSMYGFDIPMQSVMVNNVLLNFEGYKGFNSNQSSCVYNPDNKRFAYAINFLVSTSVNGIIYSVPATVVGTFTKQ